MIHYFTGSDTYAARAAIDDLVKTTSAALRWLDEDDLTRAPLSQWCDQAAANLFKREVLVIRDPASMSKKIQDDIIALSGGKLAAEMVVWERGEVDRRRGLYRALKKSLRQFNPLSSGQLLSWLLAEAGKKQVGLVAAAAQELVDRIGNDRWRLLSELEKLSLAGSGISVEAVRKSVPPAAARTEVFSMLDALTTGRTKQAMDAMQDILNNGDSELYILSMLAYQFRALAAVREGIDRGLSEQAIAQEASLHPYVVKKNLATAKKFSAGYFLDCLTKIMAVDFAIKQGKADMRTALVMTVAGLAHK